MGAGLLWFARVPATSVPWRFELGRDMSILPPADVWIDILPAFTIFGIGLMIMVAPLTAALMRSVPVRHSGVASAFNNAVSRVGPQLAGALLFIAITSTFYASLGGELPGIDVSSLRDQVSPLNPVADGVSAEVAAAARRASTQSFHVAMFVAALMCFVGAGVNALGIRNPVAAGDDTEREPMAPAHEAPPVQSPTHT
jgi:hypothetical protein